MQQFVLLAGPQLHSNRLDLKHIQDAAVVRVTGGRGATVGESKNILRAHFNCNKCPRAIDRGAVWEAGNALATQPGRKDGAGQAQKLTSCTKSKANDNRRQKPREGIGRIERGKSRV